ncbi:hypothetical protein KJ636_01570 [Patescibacteria group bacterium]|nr:hypothetical protein [Patescibacteria group bacterium]MBU4481144.1 hypothetical protein [Patescibacteria group bacterium]
MWKTLKFQSTKDKKSFLYFSIIILVSLISFVLIWRFSRMPEIEKEIYQPIIKIKKEKTPQEILRALTPPQPLSEKERKDLEETFKNLSSPTKETSKTAEEILKKLTPPK